MLHQKGIAKMKRLLKWQIQIWCASGLAQAIETVPGRLSVVSTTVASAPEATHVCARGALVQH